MISGRSSSPRPCAPTPLVAAWLVPPACVHTGASFPARFSCIRRTSTRLDWKTENGRRPSVFSFFFSQSALGFDRRDRLAKQLLGAAGDEDVRVSPAGRQYPALRFVTVPSSNTSGRPLRPAAQPLTSLECRCPPGDTPFWPARSQIRRVSSMRRPNDIRAIVNRTPGIAFDSTVFSLSYSISSFCVLSGRSIRTQYISRRPRSLVRGTSRTSIATAFRYRRTAVTPEPHSSDKPRIVALAAVRAETSPPPERSALPPGTNPVWPHRSTRKASHPRSRSAFLEICTVAFGAELIRACLNAVLQRNRR